MAEHGRREHGTMEVQSPERLSSASLTYEAIYTQNRSPTEQATSSKKKAKKQAKKENSLNLYRMFSFRSSESSSPPKPTSRDEAEQQARSNDPHASHDEENPEVVGEEPQQVHKKTKKQKNEGFSRMFSFREETDEEVHEEGGDEPGERRLHKQKSMSRMVVSNQLNIEYIQRY